MSCHAEGGRIASTIFLAGCATLKRNPVLAIEIRLLTGSILIHYRVGLTDGNQLLKQLKSPGCGAHPPQLPLKPAGTSPSFQGALTKLVLHSVAEIVIQRSLVALSAAIF